eukprot:CAMPEP_0172552484 /NCGR_PEP_ID=MMETSP1067-20121228/45309_1 /TAXON_ID=265564 ORGANISM="Thalassiosira punctigera, Strain Tpunct2005C2" /NCGR_SAMPLE_ID=MMETSP1067 /ASSEMBLY_ACC=CAM_ASM_000444 /LENGTH=396 /DNA_ID=CAMNT_0013340475 /DNA_START=58 /DNA_END=1248 /DNA_ORIENTATION=+
MIIPLQYSARCVHRGSRSYSLKSLATRVDRHTNSPRQLRCFSPAATSGNGRELVVSSSLPPHPLFSTRRLSDDSDQTSEGRWRAILSHALHRVHDEGWTDDAVASGTLDAGLPPSYVGRAWSAASPFGSADLVAFFMDECNANLGKKLAGKSRHQQEWRDGVGNSVEKVSSRINEALKMRVSMVLPFVASNRWHEGMAVGALPQNAYRTAQQLDEMAIIVLDHALGEENAKSPSQRAAVVAAYAAAELHLLSDGKDGTVSGSSLSLSGEKYHATWLFLETRSADVARFIVEEGDLSSLNEVPMPNPTQVMAASAVASSLAGAALSLVAPSLAAVAGHALPRAMMSVLTPLQNALGSQMITDQRDGTQPSDYAVKAEALPPFDASEEIFPDSGGETS